jgi:hypothetical protein
LESGDTSAGKPVKPFFDDPILLLLFAYAFALIAHQPQVTTQAHSKQSNHISILTLRSRSQTCMKMRNKKGLEALMLSNMAPVKEFGSERAQKVR